MIRVILVCSVFSEKTPNSNRVSLNNQDVGSNISFCSIFRKNNPTNRLLKHCASDCGPSFCSILAEVIPHSSSILFGRQPEGS